MPESSTYGVSAVRGSLRIQIENREILVPFTAIPKNDDNRTVMALKFLSDSIRSHGKRRFQPRTPLHEALYTYLRALPFHHFVGEYKDLIDNARIATPTYQVNSNLSALCSDLSKHHRNPIDTGHTRTPNTKFS